MKKVDRVKKLKSLSASWSDKKKMEYVTSGTYETEWIKAYPEKKFALIATMSSGKSTLINALMGGNILPFQNQACTAKSMVIHQNPMFKAPMGIGYQSNKVVFTESELNIQTLNEWNSAKQLNRIDIHCDIPQLNGSSHVIKIYDTSGANYAQDTHHGISTKKLLLSEAFHTVFYVISAANIGTDDDTRLLYELYGSIKKKDTKVVFLLNKIDQFDLEGDDDLDLTVRQLTADLEQIGFKNSTIIPTSGYAARLFRMALAKQDMTRREIKDFKAFIDMYEEGVFDEAQHENSTFDPPEIGAFKKLWDKVLCVFDKDRNHIILGEDRYHYDRVHQAIAKTNIHVIESYINKATEGSN